MVNDELTEEQKNDFHLFCRYAMNLIEFSKVADNGDTSYDFKKNVVIPYAIHSWFYNKETKFADDRLVLVQRGTKNIVGGEDDGIIWKAENNGNIQ